MGKIFISRAYYPDEGLWPDLCLRAEAAKDNVRAAVEQIVQKIRSQGDAALLEYGRLFDKVSLQNLQVSQEQIDSSGMKIDDSLKAAIRTAAGTIHNFHVAQRPVNEKVETFPGVVCWRKAVPLDCVGIYIPGGTAPLFSTVLMLALPAALAGCREIVLCTPPRPDGTIAPAILYAAKLAGVTRVYSIGGAQAIAAMAYGTQTIPRVNKIVGPGNAYVTCAKQLVALDGVAIDMPAGPSEVMVVADMEANPSLVAADILSQAEHGRDSQSMLVLISPDKNDAARFLNAVDDELQDQISSLARAEYIEASLSHSRAIVVDNEDKACRFVNFYAPEHLIIQTAVPEAIEELIRNAGSVFLGPWSPESAGDYASGTNHTLPTGGWAVSYSGVSLDTFYKKITVQKLSSEGLEGLGPTVVALAQGEGLEAHARAVTIRLKLLQATEKQEEIKK